MVDNILNFSSKVSTDDNGCYDKDHYPDNKCFIKFNFTEYIQHKLNDLLTGMDLPQSINYLINYTKLILEKDFPELVYEIINAPVIDGAISLEPDIAEIYLELHWIPKCYSHLDCINEQGEYQFIETIPEVTNYLEDEIVQDFFDIVQHYVRKDSPNLQNWLVKEGFVL